MFHISQSAIEQVSCDIREGNDKESAIRFFESHPDWLDSDEWLNPDTGRIEKKVENKTVQH